MKSIKRICVLLCLSLSASCFSMPSQAVEASAQQQMPYFFEETMGTLVNVFAKFFNKLTKTDETNIPSAPQANHSWQEYSDDSFVTEPEQILSAQTWVAVEVAFESEKTYANPFNDVDIELLLCGNGRLYTVPGFWDGGNVWKVRFVCPSEGEWYFKTVCTDESNSALHNRTGKVNCVKYTGEHDIYAHGFVTCAYGEKYFTYDDGTPFFYLGDTHWSLGDETVDMVSTICEKRLAQGFSVMQSEPIGASFDFTNGITQDDMEGFADYDEKFRIIAENGFVHANAQFFFPAYMEPLIANNGGYSDKTVTGTFNGETVEMRDFADSTKAYLEKVSRYWVARYGAYPVIWTLGQETDNDFYWNESTHPDWNFANNPYKLVAQYIAKYDPYDHPLSAHQENAGGTSAYGNGENASDECKVYNKGSVPSCFRDVPEHNFYAAQWHTGKTSQSNFNLEKDYWYNSQGKPVINYEGQYCYLWTKNFGSRMQGWSAYLNGMYGYGWGAHDTWSYLNIFDEENDSSDGVDTITSEEKINATWQDTLEYPSAYQVGYMRNLLEETEWYNFIPRFDNRAYFVPSLNVYYVYASNSDNTEIMVYFYSFTDKSVAQKANTRGKGGIKTGTVGNLEPNTEYVCCWFDPITGERYPETRFISNSYGTHYLGEKPKATDMAILIRKAN